MDVEREFADVHRYAAPLMKRESFTQDSPPFVNTLMYKCTLLTC